MLKELLSKNPLREMAETDRKVLAVCLTAAFVFWLILNLSRDYSITRPVVVDYLVDPERVLVGRMPETLDGNISGSGWNLIWESFRRGPLPVEVDVRNRENLRLSALDLERQAGRNLSSNKLKITLPGFESLPILTTPKEGKRVPVTSRVTVTYAEGHLAVSPPELRPDSITISGALDALEDLSEWPTEPLLFENANKPITTVVRLAAPGEGLTLSRPEINFSLNVEAFIEESVTVPVRLANGEAGYNYEFTPKDITLTVSLPQSAFGSLRADDFELVADLTGLRAGDVANSVPLTLVRKPVSVVSVRFEPRVVEYYVVE